MVLVDWAENALIAPRYARQSQYWASVLWEPEIPEFAEWPMEGAREFEFEAEDEAELPEADLPFLFPLHAVLSASARATGPHREFNKYLGAPKTQPDVELRRGSGSIEIKQILSATSRETLFSGTACLRLVIAPVHYYRRLLSPTSDTHIGLLSPPFSASATSWRLLGHQQARLQIRVRFWP